MCSPTAVFTPPPLSLCTVLPQAKCTYMWRVGQRWNVSLKSFVWNDTWGWATLYCWCGSKQLQLFISSNLLTYSSGVVSLLTAMLHDWSATVHPIFIPFNVLNWTSSSDLCLHQLCYLHLYSPTSQPSCSLTCEKEPLATRCHSALVRISQLQQPPTLLHHYLRCQFTTARRQLRRAARWTFEEGIWTFEGQAEGIPTFDGLYQLAVCLVSRLPRWNSEIENTPLVAPLHSAAAGCKSKM